MSVVIRTMIWALVVYVSAWLLGLPLTWHLAVVLTISTLTDAMLDHLDLDALIWGE